MNLSADHSQPEPLRDDALAFLLSRIDYERTATMPADGRGFKLDRMVELLERLGNPQQRLAIVHVAGTKGKGSTSAMIAAMLSAAGYKTGLFSSPHLQRIEERLAVDGKSCDSQEFVGLVNQLRPIVAEMDAGGMEPTYFELTTAMALLQFVHHRVDFAVLEVGMGGRLDSTNVCQPLVSVITSISFDHTKQLGNTLAAIAREKAGIIKPGIPVVSGVLVEEPRRVIEQVSLASRSPLVEVERDFHFSYTAPRDLDDGPALGSINFECRIDGQACSLQKLAVGLLGRHQGANAAVALATIQQLIRQGWQIPETAMRRGLAEVRWPARVEVVRRRPTMVIDAAHNLASIEALLSTLDESFCPRRRILVFATTKEKDVAGMLSLLLPRFDEVIFTRYLNNPRYVPVEELQSLADGLAARRWRIAASPADAWTEIEQLATEDDLVCVTGSFFIAAEMRQQMDCRPLRSALIP
jgi:dihydrofolate synthase/folylpolyglutamate synthase